jgi:cell division protein FtsN
MRSILIIFYVLVVHSAVQSQVTMQTNLPSAIPLNTELTFEVKINKGALTNFSKYQLEVPPGVIVQEVDSKLGSFAVEDNRVKIIWVIAPAEPEFGIQMKLIAGSTAGVKAFVHKYFYMESDNKKEIEMQPLLVAFKDSAAAPSSVSTAPFIVLQPKTASLLTTTINPAEISTKNPEVLKQQVFQLKKDSKDAYVVGEREKSKAGLKLTEANAAIAKAETLTNEDEKKVALNKANSDKQKAEEDLEVAERVLALAKSLEDNANEIETINRSINPASYSGQGAIPQVTTDLTATDVSSSQKDIEKLKESFKSSDKAEVSASGAKEKEAADVVSTGLVYRVQVGAFGKEPSRSDFKTLGKVTVTSEGGMFKVLVGSFNTKEEALKRREQVIGKGFDGFVVSYQNGVRIK